MPHLTEGKRTHSVLIQLDDLKWVVKMAPLFRGIGKGKLGKKESRWDQEKREEAMIMM